MEPLGLSDSARQCPHCGAIQNGNRGMVPLVFLLFFLLLAFSPVRGVSQRILTLRECYEKAEASAPLASENQTHTGIWQLRDANLSKGWLPSLGAGGQLVYNSSVVDLTEVMGALPVPGIGQLIKPLPHEQYKVTLEISQMIYDGGAVKGSRAVERAGLQVQKKQTEADLYQLRSQVNGYYFNLLLLDRQKELLGNFLVLIEKRLASLESARENGMALLSDIDVLTSEKIRLQQQLTENRIRREIGRAHV